MGVHANAQRSGPMVDRFAPQSGAIQIAAGSAATWLRARREGLLIRSSPRKRGRKDVRTRLVSRFRGNERTRSLMKAPKTSTSPSRAFPTRATLDGAEHGNTRVRRGRGRKGLKPRHSFSPNQSAGNCMRRAQALVPHHEVSRSATKASLHGDRGGNVVANGCTRYRRSPSCSLPRRWRGERRALII